MTIDAARPEPPPQDMGRAIPPGDPEAALRMLQEWMADESGYDEETWPELRAALDRNRPSGARKLFPDE
jgi:hypothetical protein